MPGFKILVRGRLQGALYLLAILGGLALVGGFASFNSLQRQFLDANFDSVHGARTLLKAQFHMELAAGSLDRLKNGASGAELASAQQHLSLADEYAAEGRDVDPEARQSLHRRTSELRRKLTRWRNQLESGSLTEMVSEARTLARELGVAELDRWGELAANNAVLGERMQRMRLLIGAITTLYVLVMVALAMAFFRARHAEQKLRDSVAEVRAIQQTTLDAASIGIAYIDSEDFGNRTIRMVNKQMSKIFGYAQQDLVGMPVSRLHAQQATYVQLTETVPPRLAAGEVVHDELLLQRANGEPFWSAVSVKCVDSRDMSRGVVWSVEDISERRAAESKLRKARSEAEAASRAKSEFLANMSHELRTPFAGLLGLLEVVEHSPLDARQARHISLARDSARQMQAIVNDILDYSKIEAGGLALDPIDFSLVQLLTSVADTQREAAQAKGLTLTLTLPEDLPPRLHGDNVRLRQVIDNLVNNALKFTHEGGVTLALSWQPTVDDGVVFDLAVSDTGIGIAQTQLAHIFEKFTQADSSTGRRYGGTGLGLAICRQLVDLMEGRLTVSSVPGEGSRFVLHLTLPCARAARKIDVEAHVSLAGRRVLVVDDNLTLLEVFREQLVQLACKVETASSGAQAISAAMTRRPDAILLDCQMPDMDGLATARQLRRLLHDGPHVPIVALTAHATPGDRERCLAAGMDEYLSKPASTDQIAQALRRQLLAHGSGCIYKLQGRVLLVEDNPALREAGMALLHRLGCDVVTAEDGVIALEKLKAASRNQRDFDIVLMDCQLPRMDGVATVEAWRAFEAAHDLTPTAIIAVTGDDHPATRERCEALSMGGMLIKPFDEAALFDCLSGWLAPAETTQGRAVESGGA